MTNTELLLSTIKESGMTKTAIALKAGITRDRLYTILRGDEARASEMEGIAKALRLTRKNMDEIFFAKNVVINATEVAK